MNGRFRIAWPAALTGMLALVPVSGAPGGAASGTIAYRGRSLSLAHAYLVRGPDAIDEKKTIRRLVLSTVDLGPKIAACGSMACVDANVTEGMEVDFDAGPRLNYWIALDGQRVQYSGTAVPESFISRTTDARRLAGRLSIDDSAAGGPVIGADFDAPLVRTFDRAR
jgi:hypothetical protein